MTSAGGHTDQSKLLSLGVGHHEDWSVGTGLAQPPGATRPRRRLPGRAASENIGEADSPWEGPSHPVPGGYGAGRGVAGCAARTGRSKGQSRCRGPCGAAPAPDAARTESDPGPDGGQPAGRLCGTHSAGTGRLRVSGDSKWNRQRLAPGRVSEARREVGVDT